MNLTSQNFKLNVAIILTARTIPANQIVCPMSVRSFAQFNVPRIRPVTRESLLEKVESLLEIKRLTENMYNSTQNRTTTNYTPPTDTTSPPATTANIVPSLILPNGISTPADTLLLGEIIREGATTIEGGGDNDMNNGSNAFHLPPPSPRHDGILLTEPTQWEQFADSIVKTHLDKTLRRGGGAISATTAAAMAAVVGTNGSDEHPATEQNIEL